MPAIAAEGGHVDKFEGDGLMAVFGAPQSRSRSRRSRHVRRTRDRPSVNRRATAELFEVGIGLNTGRVVAGSIGGGGRLNFSVIGDAVNVASRVEAETRETGDDLLLTEATRGAV